MNNASDPVGTLDVALAHAARLLDKDASLAAEQAGEILKAYPGHPHARLILGAARRIRGETRMALDLLEPLAREQAELAPAHLELGIAQGESGDFAAAVASLRRAVRLKPDLPDAWRVLADHLDLTGDQSGADQARARHLGAATRDPRLMEAAALLVDNKLPQAEMRLRSHLARHANDVAALRMLAEVAARLRRYPDAEGLLERCLELSPSFDAARHNYAVVLNRQGRPAAALREVDTLLAREPRNPGYLNLKAAVLANLGEYARSIDVYEHVLREWPRQPKIWMSYGHSLKTARRQDESVMAYRRAIALQPTLGEAYWSLANLKTFRFSGDDVLAMRRALAGDDLSDDDRLHFEFSVAKALEDQADFAQSFSHYAAGNSIRRRMHPYDAEAGDRYVERCKRLFTGDFFASRRAAGARSADPIFIVGLPRAGSTLLEQILSSHSLVEGTMELPDLSQIARELAGRDPGDREAPFFETVAGLDDAQLRSLGERYLASTRVYRKSGTPFFIDKMPNNWLYVGLLHLILPQAKIIDARRHPLGCCLSAYKQHFARGQDFSYDLGDLGRYYRGYVELMAHFDAVLPGRIHRVLYESTIADTEGEVRRLLEHCSLPFETQCLRFYDNERAVRTASSEQVRRPIFTDAVDHWKHFDPWLGPLKDALGAVLPCYPEVPAPN